MDQLVDYVHQRLEEWNPRHALVIDVANTPEGFKIIETNAISSSGFYAIDLDKFVVAINQLCTRLHRG